MREINIPVVDEELRSVNEQLKLLPNARPNAKVRFLRESIVLRAVSMLSVILNLSTSKIAGNGKARSQCYTSAARQKI